MRRLILWGVVFTCCIVGGLLSALPANALFTQCPAIGADAGCGILITIPGGGGQPTIAADVTQGPYDGIEDTLIGVLNNSSQTIQSLHLTSSSAPIFGFDGDGLCTVSPHPGGCPFGTTGYEGPGTSFHNISAAFLAGDVFFSNLGPGGTAFFSLEEALDAASFQAAVGNVPEPTTLLLWGTSLAGLGLVRRLRGRRN